MKLSFGNLNNLRKEVETLRNEIEKLNLLRKENETLRKEVEKIPPLLKENETLRNEIKSLPKADEALKSEIEYYKRKNKVLLDAVSPLTDLGIYDEQLSVILRPMLETYIPYLKTIIEEEKKKQRQEASFRGKGGGASSSIGAR
jgi:hypothetical protein